MRTQKCSKDLLCFSPGFDKQRTGNRALSIGRLDLLINLISFRQSIWGKGSPRSPYHLLEQVTPIHFGKDLSPEIALKFEMAFLPLYLRFLPTPWNCTPNREHNLTD